jgi:hypothetical protein
MKITVAVDESGAKNYSDKDEKFRGEFGVMVGIIAFDSCFDSLSAQKLFDEIDSMDRKMHIADLPADLQTKLRKNIFDYIKSDRNIICIYNAVYVRGANRKYHEHANDWDMRDKSDIPENIKQKSPVKSTSLHKILFDGLVSKVIYHCEQLDKTNFCDDSYTIDIVTDNVDKSILNLFKKSIDERMAITSHKSIKITTYDAEEKRTIENNLNVKFSGDCIKRLDGLLNKIKIVVNIDNANPLVIAADVIANSLSHHLKKKIKLSPCIKLNSSEAIDDYEIADHFILLGECDFYDNYFSYDE